MSKKGPAFEREICYTLSKWWTGSEEDCVFWRSDSSGARATRRRQKGKSTVGRCGDLCSTDPSSAPFTRLVTVEMKRGYNSASGSTIADLLDRPETLKNKNNQTTIEEFIEQAMDASENAGTPYWLLILRRDKKQPIVLCSLDMIEDLCEDYEYRPACPPEAVIHCLFRSSKGKTLNMGVYVTTLDKFLSLYSKDDFYRRYKKWKKQKKNGT